MVKPKIDPSRRFDLLVKKSQDCLEGAIAKRPVDQHAIVAAMEHCLRVDSDKARMEYRDWWHQHGKDLRYNKNVEL